MSEAKPTQWDETPCEHCGEPEGRHYVGRCNSVHSHKFYTPVSDSSLSYRQLVERVKELEAVTETLLRWLPTAAEMRAFGYTAALVAYAREARDQASAALSKARPNTAEGE